jgi:hypothetical protein
MSILLSGYGTADDFYREGWYHDEPERPGVHPGRRQSRLRTLQHAQGREDICYTDYRPLIQC